MASPLAGNLMRIGHLQEFQPERVEDAVNHHEEDSLSSSSWTSSGTSQELVRASRLASHLFFQLIRESPLHVSRTKSLPASYLSPSLIGTLWGLGESSSDPQSWRGRNNNNPNDIRKILRDRHGIRTNYIHSTQWTGISLARWMDLILPAPGLGRSHRRMHPPGKEPQPYGTPPPLTSAVWLMTVWEVSHSKLDFLECLLSLEATLPKNHPGILDTSNPLTLALLNDPVAREEWADSTFPENDLMDLFSDRVHGALEQLMRPPDSVATAATRRHQPSDATAMEILCAAISLNHIPFKSKPACPTGYYGFDGGGIQADCAELTVREVINVLLWDEAEGRFDVRRLPPTASRRLVELYDEKRYPFDEAGGQWFDLLSDLPGCEYFLKSPNGRPYELIPTITNISKALQIILVGQGNETVEWTSLHDLKNAWQPHKLQIFENTLTHRSSTTGELIHHEFATVHLEGSSSGIEVRLRCDMNHMSGMSKVTHLKERPSPLLVDGEQWNRVPYDSQTKQMLGLCMGGDAVNSTERSHAMNEFDSTRNLISMLTTPFGRDRRRLLTSNVSESDRIEMRTQSEDVLKSAIITACRQSHDDHLLGMTLLPWLLNETPTVFESAAPIVRDVDRDVEDCILTLPRIIIIDNTSIHDALEFNWVVHGQPLKAWARWKSGRYSMKESILGLRLSDVPVFVKMTLTR